MDLDFSFEKAHSLLKRLVCALGMVSFAQPALAQEAPTFLYRITGQGLSRPSYLLGSLHLTDARLFNFQDALYEAIASCEVFALEVHPDSMAQRVIDKSLVNQKRKLLKSLVAKEELEKWKQTDKDLADVPIEDLTLAELVKLKESRKYNKKAADNMPRFMDLHLYGLAQEQGKELIGLEAPEDQMWLLDSLLYNVNPVELLKNIRKDELDVNLLVKAYLSSNMAMLSKMVSTLPAEMEAKLLSNRNEVMLRSMEAVMPARALCAVVGAAHLPGSRGLIAMLRSKGYTVTPIVEGPRTHARLYKPAAATQDEAWYKVALPQEPFEFEMPGKPIENKVDITGSTLFTYSDWQRSEVFYALNITPQIAVTTTNRDSLLELMAQKTIVEMGATIITSPAPATVGAMKGIETVLKAKDNLIYRICHLYQQKEILVLMMAAQLPDSLYGHRMKRFLASARMKPRQTMALSRYRDTAFHFQIDFPGVPSKEKIQSAENTESWQYYLRTGGTEYLVTLSTAKPGYEFTEDNQIFKGYLDAIRKAYKADTVEVTIDSSQNFPVQNWLFRTQQQIEFRMKVLHRGNSTYAIWYVTGKEQFDEAGYTAFVNSFQLLPYPETAYSYEVLDSIRVPKSVHAPYYFEEDGQVDSTIMLVYHPALSSSLYVVSHAIDSVNFAKDDADFLEKVLENHLITNKVLPAKAKINRLLQEGRAALELQYQLPASHQYKTIRFTKYGHTLYEWFMTIDSAGLQRVPPLLDGVRIQKQEQPLRLPHTSLASLLQSLEQRHLEKGQNWTGRLEDMFCSRRDLDDLLQAAGKDMPWDTFSYRTVQEGLWKIIRALSDSSRTDIDRLVQVYDNADSKSFVQQRVLEVLVHVGGKEARAAAGQRLPFTRQQKLDGGAFFNTLSEDSSWAGVLFPEAYPHVADTVCGTGMYHLYATYTQNGHLPADSARVAPYLLQLGQWMAQKLTESDDYLPYAYDVMEGVAGITGQKSTAILEKLANEALDWEYLQLEATAHLLKRGLPPMQAIQQLAAAPYWRLPLYETLSEHQQLMHFPARYATQAAMAEAYLMQSLDDEEPDTLLLHAEKIIPVQGTPYRYYIYKAGYRTEDGMEYNPAIAGPFAVSKKEILLSTKAPDACGLLYQPFDKKKLDKQLKEYLQEIENDYEEEYDE